MICRRRPAPMDWALEAAAHADDVRAGVQSIELVADTVSEHSAQLALQTLVRALPGK